MHRRLKKRNQLFINLLLLLPSHQTGYWRADKAGMSSVSHEDNPVFNCSSLLTSSHDQDSECVRLGACWVEGLGGLRGCFKVLILKEKQNFNCYNDIVRYFLEHLLCCRLYNFPRLGINILSLIVGGSLDKANYCWSLPCVVYISFDRQGMSQKSITITWNDFNLYKAVKKDPWL